MTNKITPAQLTFAQAGKEVNLNSGETLRAVSLDDGGWKYIVSFGGLVSRVRYAPTGLEAARFALFSTEEEYEGWGI